MNTARLFSSICLITLSLAAHAGQEGKGIGDFGRSLKCQDGAGHSLLLIANAAGTTARADLDLNQEGRVALDCKAVKPPAVTHPDQAIAEWKCTEKRAGEGQLVATITSGGFIGRELAYVGRLDLVGEVSSITTMGCQ